MKFSIPLNSNPKLLARARVNLVQMRMVKSPQLEDRRTKGRKITGKSWANRELRKQQPTLRTRRKRTTWTRQSLTTNHVSFCSLNQFRSVVRLHLLKCHARDEELEIILLYYPSNMMLIGQSVSITICC